MFSPLAVLTTIEALMPKDTCDLTELPPLQMHCCPCLQSRSAAKLVLKMSAGPPVHQWQWGGALATDCTAAVVAEKPNSCAACSHSSFVVILLQILPLFITT